MPTYFVTSSGTNVGKTHVTGALVRQLRARGTPVRVLKPVLSGLDDGVESSDAARLLAALGEPLSEEAVARVSPFRFGPPLSPDMAAARAGTRLSVAELVEVCREAERALRPGGVLLVEGVGGAFVPLNEEELVIDWMRTLGAPAIVVIGSYLGTLSHTLTTLEAMRARGVEPTAIVLSESEQSPVPLAQTAEVLGRFTPLPIALVPRGLEQAAPDLLPLLARNPVPSLLGPGE